jgi:FtsP/CotA-like multicopper oxidase with cupredoxin domain
MRTSIGIQRRFASVVLAVLCVTCGVGQAVAVDHWLAAREFTKTMEDGTPVPMWGFAPADPNFTSIGTPTVPGPRLTVPPGDTTLRIHLKNELTQAPVSLVIPGQVTALSPTWVDTSGTPIPGTSRPAGDTTSRVRSFTTEAAPGAVQVYTWNNLRPGTYLYHSGTHPAVQVQMGLYGAVTADLALGFAYADVVYDNEMVLFFSEVDPALHEAVDDGTYGSPAYPSTLDYRPRYFLINGASHPSAVPLLDHDVVEGEQVLVRMFNAGLESRVPTLLGGGHWKLVAEDGQRSPHSHEQYSAALHPLKTIDAFWTANSGVVHVYDQRHGLTNAASSPGGMMIGFEVPDIPDEIITDTVTILSANYRPYSYYYGRLTVYATSDAAPGANLVVAGYGTMSRIYGQTYRLRRNISRPSESTVTVTSSEGGSDTAPLVWP